MEDIGRTNHRPGRKGEAAMTELPILIHDGDLPLTLLSLLAIGIVFTVLVAWRILRRNRDDESHD